MGGRLILSEKKLNSENTKNPFPWLILVPIILTTYGQVVSKIGVEILQEETDRLFFGTVLLASSYITLLTRGLVWIFILKKNELSRTYPLMAVSYVLVLILSFLVLGEQPGAGKITGGLVVLSGVVVLSRS